MAMHKCPICKKNYVQKDGLYDHMEKEHKGELHGLPAAQIYFNFRNKYALTKENGKCVMTGKPTAFNLTTERYERFADENARLAYREYFRKNMIKKYGKDTLLTEPEQQKKMLANRSISGTYTWASGYKSTYTGSFEKKFLEYLENELNWQNPEDIMSPAPMIFPYTYLDEEERFHIPDFYITSMNLIVNVKSAQNQHYRLRDIEIEEGQDEAIKKSDFNYLKLYDNNFDKFIQIMETIKKQDDKQVRPTKIFLEQTQLG
jgi:hypothetical protein